MHRVPRRATRSDGSLDVAGFLRKCPEACKSSDGRFSVSRLKALVLLIFAGLYTAGASTGETGAQLSFFQSRNGKTAWMIWSAATNRTDVFMEVANAPSLLLWESKPG